VEHGVQFALLVDPDAETVRFFRPDGSVTDVRGEALIDLARCCRTSR